MGRSHDHQNARLPDAQPSQPMHQRHIPHSKLHHRLGRKRAHLLQRHLPIGFIIQVQRLPSPRIVPHNPVEDQNRTIGPGLDPRHNLRRRNYTFCDLNPHTVPILQSHHSPEATKPPHLLPATHHLPAHTPDSPPQQWTPKASPALQPGPGEPPATPPPTRLLPDSSPSAHAQPDPSTRQNKARKLASNQNTRP